MSGNKKILLILVVVLLCVGLSVGGYWAYTTYFQKNTIRSLQTVLQEIDEALSKGYYSQAETLLLNTREVSGSRNEMLQVLKRGFAFGKATDQYTPLYKLSKEAVELIPGSETLWSIHVFSELKSNRFEDAYRHAIEHLSSQQFTSLKTEAFLKSRSISEAGTKQNKETEDVLINEFIMGLEKRDPMALHRAADLTKDNRFLMLEALTRMQHGSPAKAFDAIKKVPRTDFPELHFYIAYDAAEYRYAEESLAFLSENNLLQDHELLFLQADLATLQKDLQTAREKYLTIIDTEPKISWIPYINLSIIRKSTQSDDWIQPLLDAYKRFPEKKEVIIPITWYFLEKDRSAEARSRLHEYLSAHPDDPEIKLLALTLSSTMNNPGKYKAALWQLYNTYPTDTIIAQYFSWYLFGTGDFQGLAFLLKKFEREAGSMEWVHFMEGVLASVESNFEDARNFFNESAEIAERWETFYNMGLLELKQGYLDEAFEQFRRAEQVFTHASTSGAYSKKYANIFVKIALVHYRNEDYESASRQLAYGLDIDPYNLEGRLLAKKLEAVEKR